MPQITAARGTESGGADHANEEDTGKSTELSADDFKKKSERKNHRVRDAYNALGWRWESILQGFRPASTADEESILALIEIVDTVTLSESEDVVTWRWTTSEVFTVKSLYYFLQEGGVTATHFARLWKTKTPLKVKIFGWLVLLRKVLTKDNLSKRGWSGEVTCALCLDEPESIDHLFLNCYMTHELLGCLLPNKRSLRTCKSIGDLWKECSSKWGAMGRREAGILHAAWWAIWLERNRRILENNKLTARQVLADTRSLFGLWDSYCV
uniref:Reverse transcriptase zinc-binding domain-containing protein n=1 Tax=Ananas comosus var. bracteatus TaxID=296719 RepID=A0A6V7QI47_ANACO|nr:unnamed protein product [Ananas comosus var. bracteatus]